MFTLSMGTLILKGALHIYGWLPAHIALVMGVAFFLIIIISNVHIKYGRPNPKGCFTHIWMVASTYCTGDGGGIFSDNHY